MISIEEIIVEFAEGLIYMKKVIVLSLLLVTLSACSVNSASDNIDFNQDYGHFYDLREEFHLGNISYDDLLNIAYYNNDGIFYNEDSYNNFNLIKKNLLNSEIKNMIKSSYANTIEEYNSLTIYYYGTYNDYYAIRIDSSLKSVASILVTKVIDDINLVYSGRSIELFKLDN